jgi:uncharacterized RDD family membrane protein YckC
MNSAADSLVYSGFWRRFLASWIDSILLMMLSWVAYLAVLGVAFWLQIEVSGFIRQMAIFILYCGLSAPYYIVASWKWGTTVGKWLTGTMIVRADDPSKKITLGQSVLRAAGYMISSLPLCAGYLVAAFHPRKQSLHDLIAGTVCVVRRLTFDGGRRSHSERSIPELA